MAIRSIFARGGQMLRNFEDNNPAVRRAAGAYIDFAATHRFSPETPPIAKTVKGNLLPVALFMLGMRITQVAVVGGVIWASSKKEGE